MRAYISSVSPKGQITLPAEVRRMLGIRPRDRVTIEVEQAVIKVIAAPSALEASFQAVPALAHPLTIEEMTEIAAEEMAEDAASEGR